ncbi:hypothetical protein, partial [Klebsiella oxytoca]|uniref:hypothetical protein n=1 Tax=Klebsiella oxytoca TaxID=571 RepID=UPI00195531C3
TCSPAKRSASREEIMPIPHLSTSSAGGASALSGLPVRRLLLTRSPVSAAPPGRKQILQQGQQKYDFTELNRRA